MITVPAAIMQPIDASFSAFNANHGAALDANFSADATVVDEVPPFVWRGSHAASNWLKSVDAFVQHEVHRPSVHIHFERVTEFRMDHDGDDAFVTISLNALPVGMKKKPEEGLWVLTLHKSAGTWKITSASWATIPDQP